MQMNLNLVIGFEVQISEPTFGRARQGDANEESTVQDGTRELRGSRESQDDAARGRRVQRRR